jgi:hypothetical protein
MSIVLHCSFSSQNSNLRLSQYSSKSDSFLNIFLPPIRPGVMFMKSSDSTKLTETVRGLRKRIDKDSSETKAYSMIGVV